MKSASFPVVLGLLLGGCVAGGTPGPLLSVVDPPGAVCTLAGPGVQAQEARFLGRSVSINGAESISASEIRCTLQDGRVTRSIGHRSILASRSGISSLNILLIGAEPGLQPASLGGWIRGQQYSGQAKLAFEEVR